MLTKELNQSMDQCRSEHPGRKLRVATSWRQSLRIYRPEQHHQTLRLRHRHRLRPYLSLVCRYKGLDIDSRRSGRRGRVLSAQHMWRCLLRSNGDFRRRMGRTGGPFRASYILNREQGRRTVHLFLREW